MLTIQLREYQRETRRKLKEQKESLCEDNDVTLRLQGELKAINKIIRLHKTTYINTNTIYEEVY